MGAYVRLRVFVPEEDLAAVKEEINDRLEREEQNKTVFKCKEEVLDWEKVTRNYGGPRLAGTFRDYLASVSKAAVNLLRSKSEGVDVEQIIWGWAHFFFNALRGYGRSVMEFSTDAVTGFHQNV